MDSVSMPLTSELYPTPSTSTSTTTINYLPPSTVSSSSSTMNYTGPITASGEPSIDPTITWETHRSEWLARKPHPSNLRSERDPILVEKLRVLESLLTDPTLPSPLTRLPTGGISGIGMKGKGRMVEGEMMAEGEGEGEEIDGGQVVREKNDKIGEGILSSFRQGRALRNPVPLSIVTKLLYRSWMQDGTIPKDYLASNSSEPLTPLPYSTVSNSFQPHFSTTDNLPPSNSSTSSFPTLAGMTIPSAVSIRRPTSTSPKVFGRESITRMNRKKDFKGTSATRWRNEQDVASGSDVI